MSNVTAFSSLMLDHSHGVRAGQFTTKLETLQSPLDEPILLGMRPEGGLCVLLPSTDDGPTEWQSPIDIAAQWEGAATVKDFAFYQNPDTLQTSVALLIHASAPGSAGATDMLFVAEGFSPCDRTAWTDLRRSGQTLRAFDASKPDAMSRADRVAIVPVPQPASAQTPYGIVVAGQRADGTNAIGLYAKNAATDEWRGRDRPVPGAQTAAKADWKGLVSGVPPSGASHGPSAGFFCLAGNDIRFATLTADGLGYQSEGAVTIGSGAVIDSIATAASNNLALGCVLYGGGSGIYRWDSQAIARNDPPRQLLTLDPPASPAATRIVACPMQASASAGQPQSVATVAFLSGAGVLYAARDALMESGLGEVPVPIESDVSTMACVALTPSIHDPSTSRQVMALSYTDGHTSLMERDTAASASDEPWDIRVALTAVPSAPSAVATQAPVDAAVEQQAYCTRIIVSGDPSQPAPFARVTLSASATCGATINGTYVRMPKGVPIPVSAGPDGAISLTVATVALNAPTFTLVRLAEEGVRAAANTTVIDPAASTMDKLRALSTAADITKAKDCHGQPVFDTPPDNAPAVVAFLKTFFEQKDLAAKRGAAAAAPSDKPRHLCLHRTAKGTRLLVDDEAHGAFAEFEVGTVLNLGTLLLMMWASRRLKETLIGIRTGTDGLTYLVVDFGVNVLYSAQWHFGERATAVALDWLLQQFLQLPAEKIVGWLGWTFDWKRVGRLHGAVRRLSELTIEFGNANAAKMVDKIDMALDALQGSFAAAGKLSGGSGTSPFLKQKLGDLLPINGTRMERPPAMDLPPVSYIFEKAIFGANSGMFSIDQLPVPNYSVFDAGLTTLEGPVTRVAANLQAALGDIAIDKMALGELLQLAAKVGITDEREGIKSAFTQLLQTIRTVFDDAGNQLTAPVRIPVLNSIWSQQLGQTTPLQTMDLFCLAAACGTSFLGDAMRFTTLSDKQIATITDPKHTTLEELFAALAPRKMKVGASVQAFAIPALGGLFQILSGLCSYFSTAAGLIKMYGPQDRADAGTPMRALIGPWDGNKGAWQYHVLNRISAVANLLAYIFCSTFFILTFAMSPIGKTAWYVLYAVSYLSLGILYLVKDFARVHADRTNEEVHELLASKWLDVASGLLWIVLGFIATAGMATEPNVPVDLLSGHWQGDSGLAGFFNLAVGLLLLLRPWAAKPAAKHFSAGLLVAIPTALLIKGALEITMAQIASHAHISVLNSSASAGASFAVFPVDASGPTKRWGADIKDLSAPLSATPGIVTAVVQSRAFVTTPSTVVVVPAPGQLIVFGRHAHGEFEQRAIASPSLMPARATVGHLGLYVVDPPQKAVVLYDLPLNLDSTIDPTGQIAASALDAPVAAAATAVPVKGAVKSDVLLFVADGAAVKTFDETGTLKSTLSGAATLLNAPISLAVVPDKSLLLVCDRVSGILTFDLNNATGNAVPVKQWTFTTTVVTDLAVDSQGNVVYAEGASIHLLPLDAPSGADPKPASTITSTGQPLAPVALTVS